MDGLTFTKTLKNDPRLCIIPIFMLSAKGEEADIVTGLELGADDYITQPFSPKVMIARVRAALRRHKEEPQDEMAIVKHIAQAHGVHVTVKSKLGEGSRFSIHLPQNKWVIFFPKSQLFHCFASLNVVLPRQLKY